MVAGDKRADLKEVANADDASTLAGARKARAVPRSCNPSGRVSRGDEVLLVISLVGGRSRLYRGSWVSFVGDDAK